MANRITQVAREVLQVGGNPSARVTQVAREVLVRVTRPVADDTLAFSVTESASVSGLATSISGTETLAAAITDSAAIKSQTQSTSAGLAFALTETSQLIQGFVATESLAFALSAEGGDPPPMILRATDTWAASLTPLRFTIPPVILSLGGQDASQYLMVGTCQVQRQIQGQSTASFTFFDRAGLVVPTLGADVKISDAGQIIFGGFIDKVVSKYARNETGTEKMYQVSCVDYTAILQRRVVNRMYPKGSITENVLLDIFENFLDDEGFDASGVFGSAILRSDLTLDYRPVSEALTAMAALDGKQWWVDFSKKIHYEVPNSGNLPAPFDISDTSENWRALEHEYSHQNYRNREILKSNRNLQCGAFDEVIIANGAQSFYPTRFPTIAKPIVKVGGVEQAMYQFGVDPPYQNGFYWGPRWYGVWHGLMTFAPAGTEIEIIYGSYLSNAVLLEDADAIAEIKALEGGSGKWEKIDDIKDVDNFDLAVQIAQAILDRSKHLSRTIRYETDEPGLEPGMVQHVTIPDQGIDEDFTITSVSYQDEAVELRTGSIFRHRISAVNSFDSGDWQRWLDEFVQTTKQGQALVLDEIHGWSLTGTQSFPGDWTRVTVAPINWQQRGYGFEVNVVAQTPAAGQNIEFDIRVADTVPPPDGATAGDSILGSHYLILLDGDHGPDAVRVFANAPQPIVAGVAYELWARSVPTTGGVTDPADIKIQVLLQR